MFTALRQQRWRAQSSKHFKQSWGSILYDLSGLLLYLDNSTIDWTYWHLIWIPLWNSASFPLALHANISYIQSVILVPGFNLWIHRYLCQFRGWDSFLSTVGPSCVQLEKEKLKTKQNTSKIQETGIWWTTCWLCLRCCTLITILSSSLAFTLQGVNVSKLYIQYVSPPSTPLISVLFLSVAASCQNEKVIHLLKKKKKKGRGWWWQVCCSWRYYLRLSHA